MPHNSSHTALEKLRSVRPEEAARPSTYRYRSEPRKPKPPLLYATLESSGPHQEQRLTGSRYKGKLFEKKIGETLEKKFPRAEILHEQWISFEDSGGSGWAQPDHIIVEDDLLWIVECKLTYTPRAEKQLELYEYLLQRVYEGATPILVTCVKNLAKTPTGRLPSGRIREISEALEIDRRFHVWHCFGR